MAMLSSTTTRRYQALSTPSWQRSQLAPNMVVITGIQTHFMNVTISLLLTAPENWSIQPSPSSVKFPSPSEAERAPGCPFLNLLTPVLWGITHTFRTSWNTDLLIRLSQGLLRSKKQPNKPGIYRDICSRHSHPGTVGLAHEDLSPPFVMWTPRVIAWSLWPWHWLVLRTSLPILPLQSPVLMLWVGTTQFSPESKLYAFSLIQGRGEFSFCANSLFQRGKRKERNAVEAFSEPHPSEAVSAWHKPSVFLLYIFTRPEL